MDSFSGAGQAQHGGPQLPPMTNQMPPQPAVVVPEEPRPRRSPVVPAVTAAVVASLLAGAGAGYFAGKYAGNTNPTYVNEALQSEPAVDNEPAPEGSVEQVASTVLPAVVSISITSARGSAEGSGSIISSDGYVLTNHHVIAEGGEGARIQVTLNDGSTHPADFVASDINTDVGVLKIQGVDNLPVIRFGNSDELKVGQEVVAVGSPLGLSATVTSGIVSALNRPVRAAQGGGESSLMDGIQTDAAINPGNSGGPLVDMNGNLIGMNSVIASLAPGAEGNAGSIGLGFAIPSNFAQRVAQQLIESGEARQPMLGVQVSIIDQSRGAAVAAVEPGSPAEQAGIKQGDVITRLNDRPIDSADALIAATRSREFGETVTLGVRSEGSEESRSVDVTLSSE